MTCDIYMHYEETCTPRMRIVRRGQAGNWIQQLWVIREGQVMRDEWRDVPEWHEPQMGKVL